LALEDERSVRRLREVLGEAAVICEALVLHD
jgi:hypothetical protein